jgi:hypothetical protein
MGKIKKPIPEGIMHKPTPMVWTELTPLSEHKEREKNNVELQVIGKGTKANPLPLDRAKTDLRRAFPYIFDCAAYALTHNPEKIDTDLFYSRFTMPYDVFLDYCLDDCTEQTQYLKEELYKVVDGEEARYKYIKVSQDKTVFAQPVIIALKHIEPNTRKQKTVTNIGQDKIVNIIQVQIIKELLTFEHGFLNMPKAFYAKTRRVYNVLKTNCDQFGRDKTYRELVNAVKKIVPMPMSIDQRSTVIGLYQEQGHILDNLEQGGFYPIYLAFEYIVANKKRNTIQQEYSLLKLCERCYPELTRTVNGTLYFKDKQKVLNFYTLLKIFAASLNAYKTGINEIRDWFYRDSDIRFTVTFD